MTMKLMFACIVIMINCNIVSILPLLKYGHNYFKVVRNTTVNDTVLWGCAGYVMVQIGNVNSIFLIV